MKYWEKILALYEPLGIKTKVTWTAVHSGPNGDKSWSSHDA
jgi:hypothetical protein